jgi:hypothetical protein
VTSELDFNSRAFSPVNISHFGASTFENLAPNFNYIKIVKGLYAIVAQGYQLPEKYQYPIRNPIERRPGTACRGVPQGYYGLIIHYLPPFFRPGFRTHTGTGRLTK